MNYFIVASKDASIYKLQPTQNTGLDEILEISKTYVGDLKEIAHTLVKFDLTELKNEITDGNIIATSAILNTAFLNTVFPS